MEAGHTGLGECLGNRDAQTGGGVRVHSRVCVEGETWKVSLKALQDCVAEVEIPGQSEKTS